MSDQKDEKKTNRRDFLFTATAAAGAVGVGAAVWPLVDQMNPDASVKALASTEVDVSSMQPGQSLTVLWRRQRGAGHGQYVELHYQNWRISGLFWDLPALVHQLGKWWQGCLNLLRGSHKEWMT